MDFLASRRGKKPERILIEVYTKLLGLLLLGNLAMASLVQISVVQPGQPRAAKANYQLNRSKPDLPTSPEISPAMALVDKAQNLSEPSLYKLVFVLRCHILGLGQLLLSHPAAQQTGYVANYQLPPSLGLIESGLPSRPAGQNYAELFEQFIGRLLADCKCYGLKEKRRSRPTSFLALHLSTS